MSKNIYRFIESETMRLSFSEVTDLTYISDTVGNILFVNTIVERYTGSKPEVYYTKPFINLFHDKDRNKIVHGHVNALQGNNSKHECCLAGTGRNILCEVRNNPLKDETGNIIGVIGIARDITLRKQSEQKLKILNKSLEQRVADYTTKLMEVNAELTEEMESRKRLEEEIENDIRKLHDVFTDFMKFLALLVESRGIYSIGDHNSVTKLTSNIAEKISVSREQIDVISKKL
ncbi:MAG: PAS domain S-box protein [Candidatus Kuenenia sp.]|nr:PAS domain S-box protein [Candidatus Kuenenia hertensis]